MKIGEAHTRIMQAVQNRRLQDGIAVNREITVSLVIGQDEDDIRFDRMSFLLF